jgi:hypothetical protein
MFVNDTLVNVSHKTRPWKGSSFAIAAPGRDNGKANVGYLAAGYMRVFDNTQFDHDAVMRMAKMGREAIKGAGFKRSMVRRAARAVGRHERYRERIEGLEKLYGIAMKGLG